MERTMKKSESSKSVANTPSQAPKWTSGSKFNRLLSNLERSILSQFSSSHQNLGSSIEKGVSGKSKATKSQAKLTPFNKVQQTKSSTFSSDCIITAPLSAAKSSDVSSTSALQTKQKNNEQQVQKNLSLHQAAGTQASDRGDDRITFQQTKSVDNRGNSILNKYQRQIVSTMSSDSIIVNNRLAIPPPHANEKARQQSHRYVFGRVPSNSQSFDTTTLKPAIPSRFVQASNSATRSSRLTSNSDASTGADNKMTDVVRTISSPASSAKSLPTLVTKPGSQFIKPNSSNRDDEESGFSTYQSRRSLIASANINGHENSLASPTTTNTSSTASAGELNKPNNMILIPASQAPMGPVNSSLAQHFVAYNHQQHQQQHQHQHQHQSNHIQQQSLNAQPLITSNQVPILTVKTSSNNCYNPTQVTNLNIPNEQHQSLYGIYGPNASIPLIDNSQQIYANAPPKPRRYQYYDTSQPLLTHISAPLISMPLSNGNSTYFPNHQHQHQQQQQNHQQQQQQQQQQHQQQQLFNRQNFSHISQQHQLQNKPQLIAHQPIYNFSYLQVPNSYQAVPLNNCSSSNLIASQQLNNSSAYINLPHTLTKSKSSLDAQDLSRFRREKQLTGQAQSSALHVQPHQQPHQQFIYGSRFDNLNCYPIAATKQCQQAGSHFAQGNLQRSKSVTHLLQENEPQKMSQLVGDLYFDNRQATVGPRFLAVSSASTNNLNFAGLTSNQHQQSQFNNFTSQFNNLQYHQLQQNHHPQQSSDPVQREDNQFSSATTHRNHQPQHYQQQLRVNNWPNHQAVPSCNNFSNSQQLRTQQKKANNSALLNSGRIIRHPQSDNTNRNDSTKTSLDDKIRHLMSGKDSELNAFNRNENVIYHQFSNNVSLPQAWSENQLPAAFNVAEVNSIPKSESSGTSKRSPLSNSSISSDPTRAESLLAQNCLIDSELTNRIYINESASKMGNRQYRQYNINRVHESIAEQRSVNTGDCQRKNDANSQLIVDLTTPRVLAKTQTTLLPSSSRTSEIQKRDFWQISQADLPTRTQIVTNVPGKRPSPIYIESTSQDHLTFGDEQRSNESSNKLNGGDNKMAASERNAPYYYSDLKSEEQRQALINIVHQKSLSPPPQLLSRSTDQSSTRLALKSATLHSSQARILSEGLARHHQQQQAKEFDRRSTPTNDFSSISNIAKNIDKLFESPVQPKDTRVGLAQSMLALNECKDGKDNSLVSLSTRHQQSLQKNLNAKDSLATEPKVTEGLVSKSVYSIETRGKLGSINPSDGCPSNEGDDNDGHGVSSGLPSNYNTKVNQRLSSSTLGLENDKLTNLSSNNNSHFMRDEEDFIEFLSGKGSNHRSQFEASQFSASEFCSSTSTSDSSGSGTGNNSISSPIISNPSKHLFTNGSTPCTGILKSAKDELREKSLKTIGDKTCRNSDVSNNNHGLITENNSDERIDNFNNILGNVIDVDVCPLNNLSRCSPVNN